MGIVVHSVVIGLSLGATNDTCTIKGLVAALCFHQMFEGMGLGGCILQVINITNLELAPMVNLIRTIKNNYWSYIIS